MPRKKDKTDKAARLDAEVGRMFRALAQRRVPDSIASVVDQLDEGATAEPPRRRREA